MHRGSDGVGIHDHLAVDVSCCAAGRLRQTAVTAKESLFVSIEDSHERYFRQVETLAQKIHAHQHVVVAEPEVVQNLHALQRLHLTMDIIGLYTVFQQVVGHLFGHALGQRCHEHTLTTFLADLYLVQQVLS